MQGMMADMGLLGRAGQGWVRGMICGCGKQEENDLALEKKKQGPV